ncbi:hypothetical protein CAPTEDRAFT_93240 [Capitella teleta]|uniref:L-Fucosyltransferase n=1 Tax=Capitella teleta TaxID=283909 RepID=X2BBW8_CAPTE|nr:hypothetical protein CAPTEDRAFT_93240 [Capitella teleta]|eukprot:ELU10167.1 hypothetical protein CAPTEDRAFT_93240 [Capitella teleta]
MIFTEQLQQLRGNVSLCCYLQSWKYFEGFESTIRQEYSFKNAVQIRAREELQNCQRVYTEKFNASAMMVGVHIRRRDVASNIAKSRGFADAPLVYIQKAMQFYEDRFQHVVFVLVSDDHSWCEKNFRQLLDRGQACLPPDRSAIQDLCVLSLCNNSIVTVGSFGWWSAFLAGGQVVYFDKWPRRDSEIASHFNRADYFPPHWVGLS